MKYQEICEVISQSELTPGIFDLVLQTKQIAVEAKPGQFMNCFTNDPSKILPRPISLCGIDKEKGRIRLVYRVNGKRTGTAELSKLVIGDRIQVMGPLGTGFPIEEAFGKRILLFGGGIGIPPMLETGRALQGKAECCFVLGYRDQCFLEKEFETYGKTVIATDDGSSGHRGTVLEAVHAEQLEGYDMVFACGPKPMLRAVKAYAEHLNIPCWISMEERMACGVGACLACICETETVHEHFQVNHARVCIEGPVFKADQIVL